MMNLKTFRGQSTRELIKAIRADLGDEALVLETRSVRGTSGEKLVEMVAAVERPMADAELSPRRNLQEPQTPAFEELTILAMCAANATEDTAQAMLQLLLARNVRPAVAQQLLDEARELDPDHLQASLRKRIGTVLGASLGARHSSPRVIAFVGPTGVGKTTSAAKLAARLSAGLGHRVGLVGADPYRVGAVEQLTLFADILGLPARVTNSPEEIGDAVRDLEDCDWVLIDTQGRSPREVRADERWARYLSESSWIEPLLVLAANTREADLDAAVDAFKAYGPKSLVFTKLDEATSLGSVLNQAALTGLPVGFMTNGQRVPEDLILTTASKMTSLVLGEAA